MTRPTEYAVPQLPSRDLHETLAFYERLGFHNAGDAPDVWGYLIIRRGTIELHFHPGESASPGACFVWVDDVDALSAAWRLGEPTDTEYGVRTFEVVDPSGNRLRFGTGAHECTRP